MATKIKITEQEIIEAAMDAHVENGGDAETIFELNAHQEFGREYVEAIPVGKNSTAETPRFFLDHYEVI